MSYSFSRDRTAELNTHPTESTQKPHDWGYTPTDPSYEMNNRQPDLSTSEGFFEQLDRIKSDMESINYNIDKISNLHNTLLQSSNEQQSKKISKELEQLKTATQQTNTAIKKKLQELQDNNHRQRNNPDTPMHNQQVSALKRKFMDTIQRYQDVERNYQLRYRQRIERQIRIVKPEASQDEVDTIIDSEGPPQVFAQSLMSAGRQGQAKAVLSEVQTRQDDIKHIEKTIIELHQLFMDMSMMVEQQGETLTTIENQAEQTQTLVQDGNTFISKAIQSAKATRTKKWCCFFLCIGICVMIAILVWWFGFNHVGVGDN
ncbi:t-SNARE [Sporodiniella umbellata]|nr:t-SNARE [Sporodiniella umbellata]